MSNEKTGANASKSFIGSDTQRTEIGDLGKAVDQVSRSLDTASDDPNRSTIHTGKTYTGYEHFDGPQATAPSVLSDGAGPSLNGPFEPETSEDLLFDDAVGVAETLSLDRAVVAENTPGAVVGHISVVVPDAGDSHSFEVSDDRFEVADGMLRLREGVSLDHEAKGQIDVTVTATDAGGLSVAETLTLTVSDVNETPETLSLDRAVVAENTPGAVVGHITVVDPDAGDSHSFEVSDDRFEVADGMLRLREGVSLDHEAKGQIDVTVTATDAGGLSVAETLSVHVAPTLEMTADTGFQARYFDLDHKLKRLDDVDWSSAPTFTEVTGEIKYANSKGSFWEGGDTETFAAQITGTIAVTEAGVHDFFLSADDGARLFINGQPVVDNDGLHSYKTRTGEIDLETGLHHIEVRYFENTGRAGLKLEWDGPGTDGRSLVNSAGEEAGVSTVSGMDAPLAVKLPEDGLPENATVAFEGLPDGTLIRADGQVFEADASGLIDVTGVDLSLVTIQPPVDFVGSPEAGLVVEYLGGVVEGGTEFRLPLNMEVGQAQVTSPSAAFSGAFKASFFDVDHRLKGTDDIDWSSDPTHIESVSEVNYAKTRDSFWEGGSKDTFGVKIEGDFTIEEGGAYMFHAGGDDGVVVFVNGEPIVDNDGLHGFRTRRGEVELEPGQHHIEIRYFENTGHAGLKLEIEGPDTDGKELLQASPGLEVSPNGTFDLALTVESASDPQTVEIAGLPNGALVSSGSDAVLVSEQAVDVSEWDLSSVVIIPPADFEGLIDGSIYVTETAFNGAPITGESAFTLTVGDPAASSERDRDEMIALLDEKALGNEDWTAEMSDGDPDDGSDADGEVLSEVVVESVGSDTDPVSLDPYDIH